MADMTKNPWIFTSTDAGTTVLHTGPVFVRKIIWDEPSAAEADLTIQHADGTVWYSVDARNYGNGTKDSEPFYGAPITGFILAELDSGTLYVYVE